jgi:hypothetical protein
MRSAPLLADVGRGGEQIAGMAGVDHDAAVYDLGDLGLATAERRRLAEETQARQPKNRLRSAACCDAMVDWLPSVDWLPRGDDRRFGARCSCDGKTPGGAGPVRQELDASSCSAWSTRRRGAPWLPAPVTGRSAAPAEPLADCR